MPMNRQSSFQTAARIGAWLILFTSGSLLIWASPLAGSQLAGARHLAANLLATYLLGWLLAFVLTNELSETTLRFIVTTVSLLAVWLLVEAVSIAGLVDYRRLMRADHDNQWLQPGNRFDTELLVVREPYLRVPAKGGSPGNIARAWCLDPEEEYGAYPVRYDRNGFRNAQDMTSADVAVLGDSYMEGDLARYEELLTTQLGAMSGLDVVNLGLAGYGPQQELIVLRRYALGFEPDVVLWFFHENDLADLRKYERLLEKTRRGVSVSPTRLERSFLNNALDLLYGRFGKCERNPAADQRSGLVRTADGRRQRMYFSTPVGPLERQDTVALDQFALVLEEAHSLTSPRRIDLVVVFVPAKLRVYASLLDVPAYSILDPREVNDLPNRVREIAATISTDIGFLDLTPSLTAAAAAEPVYWAQDTHWTPAGHRAAAEATWRYLQRSAVEPGSGPSHPPRR